MAGKTYYMLVSSLPRLPHFELAEWLPLSRKELDQRLALLTVEHRWQLYAAEGVLQWQQAPLTQTSKQFARHYSELVTKLSHAALREFVDFHMIQRTALTALRRRCLGLGPPAPGEVWGAGPWTHRIRASWERADLGIGHILPWLDQAAQLIKVGDALGLERLLMNVAWTRLGRIAERSAFGFEPVMAFVFRWGILERWLSYDADKAKTRFQGLLLEITHEQEQQFN